MKRTWSIEIIRYTRRVTWAGEEGEDASDVDVESQAATLLLEVLGTTQPAPEVVDPRARMGGCQGPPALRWKMLRWLTGWLHGR